MRTMHTWSASVHGEQQAKGATLSQTELTTFLKVQRPGRVPNKVIADTIGRVVRRSEVLQPVITVQQCSQDKYEKLPDKEMPTHAPFREANNRTQSSLKELRNFFARSKCRC